MLTPLLLGLASIAVGLICLIKPQVVSKINTATRTRVLGWLDPTAKKPAPLWGYRLMGVIGVLLGCGFLFIAWSIQFTNVRVYP
ncbi:hypothetical protein [Agromyces aerolatus]|uniref:hypothetical protein n=1 Tax=Agromyces sp. LY-1074 TaxID=3074080 RepID=UPI00285E1CE9|nr:MULTISPECIES: hypothetical protein [unclassified Agromyces]MDR5701870.1 hypothetical protein [Agromyces sp. LY-1074]MDR5708116.1 hypothetical protein [Agromyces sp. LY-1358]